MPRYSYRPQSLTLITSSLTAPLSSQSVRGSVICQVPVAKVVGFSAGWKVMRSCPSCSMTTEAVFVMSVLISGISRLR